MANGIAELISGAVIGVIGYGGTKLTFIPDLGPFIGVIGILFIVVAVILIIAGIKTIL